MRPWAGADDNGAESSMTGIGRRLAQQDIERQGKRVAEIGPLRCGLQPYEPICSVSTAADELHQQEARLHRAVSADGSTALAKSFECGDCAGWLARSLSPGSRAERGTIPCSVKTAGVISAMPGVPD